MHFCTKVATLHLSTTLDANYYHHFTPFVSNITFEDTRVVSSSDTFLFRHRHGGSRLGGARREDQIYLFEQPLCWLFDLSFCLVWALLPLRLPYPCFSLLQLYSTTSNGMGYLIWYAWADTWLRLHLSLALYLHLFSVFFFICDSSAAPQRPMHCLLSPHLASSSVPPPVSAVVQHCPLRWVRVLLWLFFFFFFFLMTKYKLITLFQFIL